MMRRTFGYLSFELKLIFGCFILGYFLGMRFQGSTIQLHTVMSGHRDLLANKASQNHELQSNISAALRERKLVHESLVQIAEDVFVYEPIAKPERRRVIDPSKNEQPAEDYENAFPCIQQTAEDGSTELPVYLLVAGVEGSGHHAMETVWGDLKRFYNITQVTYNPGLHSFAKDPEVHLAYQYSSIKLSTHQSTLEKFLAKPWNVDSKLIIDSRDSYPMGGHVGNLAHPDIVYLSKLDGKLIDFRVLFLYRDPTAATLSAVRRFSQQCPYKNYEWQARSCQESLVMMNSAIPSLKCGKLMYLGYDEFTASPFTYNDELAKLLSVDSNLLKHCYGQLKKGGSKHSSEDGPTLAAQKTLHRFFAAQQVQWPLLSGAVRFPLVRSARPMLPHLDIPRFQEQQKPTKSVAKATKKATRAPATTTAVVTTFRFSPVVVDPRKFLKINWFSNLGFNNIRFVLEVGLSMSIQLGRQLILPSYLRMRKCVDDALCTNNICEEQDIGEFWCPFSVFMNMDRLKRAGAIDIRESEDPIILEDNPVVVSGIFDRLYSQRELWLDKIPTNIRTRLHNNAITDSSVKFPYFKFRAGCEMTRVLIESPRWDSRSSLTHIYSFKEELAAHEDAPLLHLDGTPHFIGLTPFFWSMEKSIKEMQSIWENHVIYHQEIRAYASEVATYLRKRSATGVNTFMSVHMRRGDFEELGWLGDASNLDSVRSHIQERLYDGECFYMATDETDPEILGSFRVIGAYFWSDVREAVPPKEEDYPILSSMIGFEDYIGLIEQVVCSKARAFFGSKCSSFTGGILNMRKTEVDDIIYNSLTKDDMWGH